MPQEEGGEGMITEVEEEAKEEGIRMVEDGEEVNDGTVLGPQTASGE